MKQLDFFLAEFTPEYELNVKYPNPLCGTGGSSNWASHKERLGVKEINEYDTVEVYLNGNPNPYGTNIAKYWNWIAPDFSHFIIRRRNPEI